MRFARPAALAFLTLLASSGCRTAVDNLARRDPILPNAALDAHEVVDAQNRNAERIESLRATNLDLTITAGGKKYGVDGKMAMERPRNFKLDISHSGYGEVADIGSNDEKFWFWVKDSSQRAVYYCKYDETGSTPLVSTFQPDWIVEALGLRLIPDAEAKEIEVTRGEAPGTVVLTHRPTKTGGEMVIRKTIINEKTNLIAEHRIYSEKLVLLARATVQNYMKIPIAGEDEPVLVPQKLKLEWFREKMAMEVTFSASSTEVNAKFTTETRDALFVERPRKGYERVNLAEGAGARAPRERTTVRETLPAPPTGGVQLGLPEPAASDTDGASRPRSDLVVLSADLPALPALNNNEDLDGPAAPKAPEIEFAKPATNSAWRNAAEAGFER